MSAHILCHDITSAVRPGTATPEAVLLQYEAAKDNQVASRSTTQGSPGLYDPAVSVTSHKLSSATGAASSSYKGIPSQEKDPFADGATSLEPGGALPPMPGDDSGALDKLEQPRGMSTPDQGKRPGLTRGRSQSGSCRRSGGRQSVQAPPSQNYHQSPPPHTQDSIANSPGAPGSFPGPSPQYLVASPYDPRSNYGGQYTIPSQSPLGMVHPSSQFPYTHTFHPGNLPSPQDPIIQPLNMRPGFQQILQPHGPVYSYQRHSPESAPSSHSFPGGYQHSQVAPSPPMSPMSTQNSGVPLGPSHAASFGSGGQFHSMPFSGTLPPAQYPPFGSQPSFPPPTSMYQYSPSTYPQSFVSTPSDLPESQGTWWYLPAGAPPPLHPFEHAQPSFQSHYPARRHDEAPYSPTGPGHSASTSPAMYQPASVRSAVQPGSRNDHAVSSSPAVYEGTSPVPTNQRESNVLPTSTMKPAVERTVVRRPYHPNPPAHRSEWVMWAGNVPSDAEHDELWRFFKHPRSRNSTHSASPEHGSSLDESLYDGVSSIFLISRSNCAFVNFDSEAHLHSAIQRFNGKMLRPNDPRCPRIVCRVRRKDDDLKAGVGGQRGMGIHTRWIKEKGHTEATDSLATPPTPESTSLPPAEQLGPLMTAMSLSSDEGRPSARTKQSSSGSYASTNSSILTRHFPKRYFILKSLTQFDLDLSVEKGLWATQKHNEGILDQAYRTSTDVYLIFGVNKSGEFYGYAKMAGPILQGEHQVSWASRTTDSTPSSRSSLSAATGRGSRHSEEAVSPGRLLRRMDLPNFFSPAENRLVEESPRPLNTPETNRTVLDKEADALSTTKQNEAFAMGGRSAPAELGPTRRKFTMDTPPTKRSHGTDLIFNDRSATDIVSSGHQNLPDGFQLDPSAPMRAQRNIDDDEEPQARAVHVVSEEDENLGGQPEDIDVAPKPDGTPREGWGESFKIEWLCTDRLPFHRTRHLRNPWNHNREIKVSRDGTELESGVGQKLLDDWKSLAAEPTVDATTGAPMRPPGATEATPGSTLSIPQERDSMGEKGNFRRS